MEHKGFDLFNNMNEGVDAKDRISELPEFIIHLILSFLSTRAIAKNKILSKRWNGFVSSYPVLNFNEDYFKKKRERRKGVVDLKFRPKYPEFPTRKKFMHSVNNSLVRFCEQKICIDTLMLQVTLTTKENTALLNKWIELGVENWVKVLEVYVKMKEETWYRLPETVFSAKRITVLKLAGCKLEHPKNTINLYSLKKLSLLMVYVDERMLQNLVSCCHSIEHLTLENCFGLKKIQAYEPIIYLKIKSGAEPETVYIEGSSVRYLHYERPIERPGQIKGEIKVNACQNLRELRLERASITDQCLYDLNTKFPHLHSLILRNCNMLEMAHISSHSLEQFMLDYGEKLQKVEMDTPNLQDFKVASNKKFPKLFFKSGSCQTIARLSLCSTYHLNTDWFLELREFFKNANRTKTLSLTLFGQVACTLEEFLPTPPYDLELLKLDLYSRGTNYSAFVDGLLLTCHPKTLSVNSNSDSCKNFKKILCERLTHKYDSDCCGSTLIQCWSHSLKNVIIKKSGGNEVEMPLDQDTLFDELDKEKRIHLKLLWQSQ